MRSVLPKLRKHNNKLLLTQIETEKRERNKRSRKLSTMNSILTSSSSKTSELFRSIHLTKPLNLMKQSKRLRKRSNGTWTMETLNYLSRLNKSRKKTRKKIKNTLKKSKDQTEQQLLSLEIRIDAEVVDKEEATEVAEGMAAPQDAEEAATETSAQETNSMGAKMMTTKLMLLQVASRESRSRRRTI